MKPNLFEMIPTSKFETEKAEALIQLGFPAVKPIMSELMKWTQDMNWPVAQVLHPFLVSIGASLEPYIRDILNTDDQNWKYRILQDIVDESAQLIEIFKPELDRIATNPTVPEKIEELDELSKSILEKVRK